MSSWHVYSVGGLSKERRNKRGEGFYFGPLYFSSLFVLVGIRAHNHT